MKITNLTMKGMKENKCCDKCRNNTLEALGTYMCDNCPCHSTPKEGESRYINIPPKFFNDIDGNPPTREYLESLKVAPSTTEEDWENDDVLCNLHENECGEVGADVAERVKTFIRHLLSSSRAKERDRVVGIAREMRQHYEEGSLYDMALNDLVAKIKQK